MVQRLPYLSITEAVTLLQRLPYQPLFFGFEGRGQIYEFRLEFSSLS